MLCTQCQKRAGVVVITASVGAPKNAMSELGFPLSGGKCAVCGRCFDAWLERFKPGMLKHFQETYDVVDGRPHRKNPRAMTFRKAESPSPSEPATGRRVHFGGKLGKPPLVAEPTTACSVCHERNGLAQRGGVCCDCREAAGEKWCDVCEAPAAEGFSVGASLVCKKHADALLAETRAECPGCGTQIWTADGPFCTGCDPEGPGDRCTRCGSIAVTEPGLCAGCAQQTRRTEWRPHGSR